MRNNEQKIESKIVLPDKKNLQINSTAGDLKEKFINFLKSADRVIIFSSHLDDAILSAGSLLFYLSKSKIKVEVINIFTAGLAIKTKSTRTILQRAKIDNAMDYFRLRKEEDKKAFAELGISKVRSLDFIDAAFRVDKRTVPIYPNNQVGVAIKDDKELSNTLLKSLKDLNINVAKTVIFGPLALGRHVDHVLVRNSVTQVFKENIIYYEDYPYSYYLQQKTNLKNIQHYENLPQRAHHENEDRFIKKNELIAVTWNEDYEVKKKSILRYLTQKESLFSSGPMILPIEKFYLQEKLLEV